MGEATGELRHKCYYDEKSEFYPCNGMNIVLLNSKEIACPEIMSFSGIDAGKTRNAYVGWKGNKKNGVKGLAFNRCPFCGQDILNDKGQLCTKDIPLYPPIDVRQ